MRIVAYMHFDESDACLALTVSPTDSINNQIIPKQTKNTNQLF
ncbi:hypothetical protein [Acinetobacter phage BUCT628]|nr:hypothetical protein [Acinetobacter phage BUCT628]